MRLRSPMASTSRVRLISGSASLTPDERDVVLSLQSLGADARFVSTLEAARRGDPQALGAVYRMVYPRVMRFLRVVRPSAAEELAWATWLDAVAELPGFRGDQSALVARCLAIAYGRAHARTRSRRHGDDSESGVHASLDGLADLSGLPRASAEVLLLRVLGGMTIDEVAAVTHRRHGTVRLLQRLALRRLSRTTGHGGSG